MLGEKFTPTCFLSALGARGLSVSFYMYLMFIISHKGSPMTTFDFFYALLIKADWLSVASLFAAIGILVFGMFFIHAGLIPNKVIEANSLVYFSIMAPFVYIQYITICYFFKLKRKFF